MFKEFEFLENIKLSNFSTMKVGGKARYIVFPKNHIELIDILNIVEQNNQKYFVLGNGSNVLFDDKGFNGTIISLKHLNKIVKYGNCVSVGAGVNLFTLNNKLLELGLSGLEWSFGIPATLGGFVVMNGGCFGHEICEYVEEIIVLNTKTKKILRLKRKKLHFSYRKSNLEDCIVLYIKLSLIPKNKEEIQSSMMLYLNKKKNSQPCDLPSLGSIFKLIKTDEIIYPAKLIDNMGFKGVKIGGAEISCKHAGFIVNVGNATSFDILRLIELIEKKFLQIGITLEREIIYLKEEDNTYE